MSAVIGILGASGFIGSRIIEIFHLEKIARVRPIVRSVAHLARSARFDLDGLIADGFSRTALRTALDGCDVVVHAIAGDRKTMLGTLEPVYKAASDAGVRRIVYLSSAAVHGQAPPQGTDERSPLSTRHPVPYNTSKVLAERTLQRLRAQGRVELVVLRPGIVFGPRSQWTGGLADELLSGKAYLVDGGNGICNCIYVDNLIHGIQLAMTAQGADRQAFLLGERETVTWRDLYRPVAKALGFAIDQIPSVSATSDPASIRSDGLVQLAREWARKSRRWVPATVRRRARPFLAGWRSEPGGPASPWITPELPAPAITLENSLLHRCGYKLPWTKAHKILGYEPQVSFTEGCRRSIAWLEFAGYPVIDPAPVHQQTEENRTDSST